MLSFLLQEIISEIIQVILKFSFNKIKENIKEDKIERPKEARLEKIKKPKEEKTAEKKIACQDMTSFTYVEKFIKTCFEDVRNENLQYRFIFLILLQKPFDRIDYVNDYVNIRLINAINNNCLDFSLINLYLSPMNEESKIYIETKLRNACEKLIHDRFEFNKIVFDEELI